MLARMARLAAGSALLAPSPPPPAPARSRASSAFDALATRTPGGSGPASARLLGGGEEELAGGGSGGSGLEELDALTLWFRWNSTAFRKDRTVDSAADFDILVLAVEDHLAVAPDTEVVLHGYASAEGDASHNDALSEARAQRVKDLLMDAGFPGSMLSVKPHGEDASYKGLKGNRRVEAELLPSISSVDFEGEDEVVEGTVPRTGPKPLEPTSSILTPSHWALRGLPRVGSDPIEEWDAVSGAEMAWERFWSGKSATLADYKDRWVKAHRKLIAEAAASFEIPAWFLAGVAWAEVGGDHPAFDSLGYVYRRDIGLLSKPAVETSFGAVQMQIRRAAEELGYDPAALTSEQMGYIIKSLEDPQQNLLLVASHLDRLRNIDSPGKTAELLEDDDLRVLGARYNRGPDLPLAKILENTSYGDAILAKRERLEGLLAE